MVRKRNNQLPNNLPQLQNLIKRDPLSYSEEFQQQYEHFQSVLDIFEMSPEQQNSNLDEIVMFMANIAHCYPKKLENFPQRLIDLLLKHNTVLASSVRMILCKALILLRNKNLVSSTDLLELFFKLLKCQDKSLREFLENHIITDIKNLNSKHKNAKLNTTLQNFMFTMLKDNNARAAKMSINIMIELYKKNIWNDAKTVNVIASGCFFKNIKVMTASLKFFLEKDADEKGDEDSSSDEEINPKSVMMANKFNKKTRKREKQLDRVKKLVKKVKKKKSTAPSFNFSALHLIHDPQGMAEKLFAQLESSAKKFEIKLMMLDVISRLIGVHNLLLPNFYSYLQRFIQPHQRGVTRILQFTAQASHELVTPEDLESVLKTIANNFITERNSSDVMAIGINAVREICARCPLAMTDTLLQDLSQYKKYRERAVMMAAQSLIHLFRYSRPELLHKKDRGRPNEAISDLKSKNYGEIDAKDYIPGAEILLSGKSDHIEINSDSSVDDDDDKWVDIQSSDDNGDSMAEDPSDDDNEREEGEQNAQSPNAETYSNKELKSLDLERKNELAKKISLEKILTDEDFKKIEMANIRKQFKSTNKGIKRKIEETKVDKPSELVKLDDIEYIYKKRKHDKQSRMESVEDGRKDREKFGYKDGRMNIHCSKTNREKRKTKSYQMIKHKVKSKVKRSFKDKQISLRNHLLKLKKMK